MKRSALALISLYQRQISGGLPPACRFQPTCSHYAYGAVEQYGAVRGGLLAAWRLLRCNPLNDGGFDPVPERRSSREHFQA
jgi:putative membrane protein insertion efficiency factor